jgi:hypothetical protein
MASTDFTNGSTLTDAEWFDDTDQLTYGVLTGVAGTNTITATGPVSLTYGTKTRLWFTPANTNNGATTINITPSGGSALGAKNIFCGGAACVGGELRQNIPVLIIYDGTQFNIVGPYVGGFVPSAITLPNNVAYQAKNASGTVREILKSDANSITRLSSNDGTEVVGCAPVISPPASAAARAGSVCVDSGTVNRLVFYDKDGNRFYIEGTTF